MSTANTALQAAQGLDTYDLLQHIAWTDVIKPQLEAAKAQLTQRLVDVTLRPLRDGEETREQIAGKLFGIGYITTCLEKVLRQGEMAKDKLASENLFLQ